MMKNKKVELTLIISAVIAICFCSCAVYQNPKWIGKVDATFSYRTETQITRISKIKKGSKSDKAGLQPDDILVSVDGQDVAGLPVERILAAIKGPIGSVATLKIKRDSTFYVIEVERTAIPEP